MTYETDTCDDGSIVLIRVHSDGREEEVTYFDNVREAWEYARENFGYYF